MNPAAFDALNRASSLELYHLYSVVERLMTDPRRVIDIRMRLNLGQMVRYVDWRAAGAALSLRNGRVVAMKDAQVTVEDELSRVAVTLPYAAIEVPDGAPVQTVPTQPPESVQTRDDFSVGERVSFEDKYLQSVFGVIVRLNPKSATLDCNGEKWRVPYALLRRVLEL